MLSIEQKLEILEELDHGTPVSGVARDYNIHPTTVRRIRRNASTINQAADRGLRMLKQRKLRKATHEKLEERLYMWFVERKEVGDPITDWLLRQKALELITEFGSPSTFKASLGWVAKFKIRYDIRLADIQRIHREHRTTNNVAAEEFVSNFARQIEEERIEHNNIYNMAVSSLMWKALPVKRLAHEETNADGIKRKKERVTVGFCANMTGTHKLKPLFIHRSQHPRAIKDIMNSLPVVYKAQKNAWLDETIFTDWFQNEFKPAVRAYQQESGVTGKVMLLLNNCIAHKLMSVQFPEDPQFEILFLPPNTTTVIQPMDQGVILKAKRVFHCRMLRQVVSYSGNIQEFYDKYNLRDCINLLDEAWREVGVANIRNSWNNIIKTAQEVTPDGEEPTDPLEPQLEEVIAAITGEKPCQKKVREFLTNCHIAETTFSEADAQNEGSEEEDKDEEEATEVAKHDGGEASCEGENQEEEIHEEKVRIVVDKNDKQHTMEPETRSALEYLMKQTEQAPRYVRRSLENIKDYFMGEET